MRTRGTRSNQQQKPQQEQKHPDEWQEELNPEQQPGSHAGSQQIGESTRTAYDVKELHTRLTNLSADELREIPILQEGETLEQGATYFDLAAPQRGEFTAEGRLRTTRENLYVPKARVHYGIWNRLVGRTRGAGRDW